MVLTDPYRGKLVKEADSLKNGSWLGQTYPFYSGRMVYGTRFNAPENARTFLRLNDPSAILCKVRLNGSDVGSILWRPYEIELTPFARGGKNHLEVEVVSSMQNTWGPLHETLGDDNRWCGPIAFEERANVRDELSLFNYGLLGGAEIVSVG